MTVNNTVLCHHDSARFVTVTYVCKDFMTVHRTVPQRERVCALRTEMFSHTKSMAMFICLQKLHNIKKQVHGN